MKKVIALMALVCVPSLLNAQAFEKGGNYIHAGFGVQPYSIGPISFGYEKGISNIVGIGRFGVGGVIAHEFFNYSSTILGSSGLTQNRTTLMGRCAYHFDFNIDKMDVYAGVAVAVQYRGDIKSKNSGIVFSDNSARIFPYPSVFGGIRYYFADQFAVFAEVGYGLGYLSGGIVYRF